MSCAPFRRVGQLIGVAIVLQYAAPALGQTQQGGPVVIGPERAFETLHLYDVKLSFEAEWRRDVDRRSSTNGQTQRDVEDRVREILDVRTGGFVGHPNLLELDLGGRFWFEQRTLDFDSSGNDEHIDQTLLDWDVSGAFLKESTFPFTIYSRQTTTDIDRQFGGTLENSFRETGARINLRDAVFPTTFHVFQRRINQDDLAANKDFVIDQRTVRGDGRVELGQHQDLAWDLQYDDVDESGDLQIPRSFERIEGNLSHALEFGTTQQHSLRTQVRMFDETGDRDFRQFRFDPRLRLKHTDDLNSWFDYSYERNDRPQQKQNINRFSANLQHQLFDSVTTIGRAGFNQFRIPTDDFRSDETFGQVDVQYLKLVPNGRLAIGLNLAGSHVRQTDQGAAVSLSDQVFTFSAADLILINQRNVEVASIVITDLAGLITYVEGVDYTVLGFADRTEVRRTAGGAITPSQSVLIDYIIGPEPGGTTDTLGTGVDLRYTFNEGPLNGLSVFGRYFEQGESRSLVTPDFPENDFTDKRYGLDYNIWKLYLRAERTERDSSFAPVETIRLEGRYSEPLGRGSSLVLSALYQDIDRPDDGIRTTTTSISGRWNQRINSELRMSWLLQYQMTEDNISTNSDAIEHQFDLVWRHRQVELYAQIRNSIRNTNADDTDLHRFILGIRREF